ncbi:MAG TPA: bifunctional adenosylcobinamide kinase/adenosylcobinamide-phosphate guanylyltransferase [Dehalococcoidia bacterium]|nr:bifunctional adenosylcobinamide kinase/adenosylcobinamide-phosphate guanylyltransferase [Dehalococcoidia bacterium]
MGEIVLVLGGARSGKSRHAEGLAAAAGAPVCYFATAVTGDEEMAERIARHRAVRPKHWQTVEAPYDLELRLPHETALAACVLIDCLSIWLSNELLRLLGNSTTGETLPAERARACESDLLAKLERLLAWAAAREGLTIIVSNEVGSGVVPPYALGRLYRDVLGRANQLVADSATRVLLVVAGIAVDLRRLAGPAGEARL